MKKSSKAAGKLQPKTEKRQRVELSLSMLQDKANEILNSTSLDTQAIQTLLDLLKLTDNEQLYVQASDVILVLEVIFKNLLKRNAMHVPQKKEEHKAKNKHAKCLSLYKEFWAHLLNFLTDTDSKAAAEMSIKVAMQLLAVEAKHPISSNSKSKNTDVWPLKRLHSILFTIINADHTQITPTLKHFEKYARCLDVLQNLLQILPQLSPVESTGDLADKVLNYLAIVNLLDMGKSVLNDQQYHVKSSEFEFDYEKGRQDLNLIWQSILKIASSTGLNNEKIHRQILVVLLERILPHLEDPIQLTDFLMDSLHQFDGAIALLALQGIFSLMQKQNITYPDVYEKLYNMFYPRMFFNKFKARLFYLADIFLTSTHLPENLVAAFVKRLARLSLSASPEDALIMIRFVCNLLLRHTGLQRLIRATPAEANEAIVDPYDINERNPIKSKALESSLWEMVLLQKHAVPEVAQAARFVSQSSLPVMEFDLGPLLERRTCDLFDDEVKQQAKQFMLHYDRPSNFALPKQDIVTKYWNFI
ncbi:nucleolar complex protein 4 homolog [Drosophila tropicalis]|uniref:nucleolar complex protein 4 homolog n=1 Tax=Drosophila tropicalis TaxID=46794 RepID=UPI0035AB9925